MYSEESGVLRYKAPKGTVTPDIKEVLRKYKNEIIDYLKDNVSQTFQNKIQQRYEKFPLTDIQNSYVMGRNNMYELGGVGCHGYLEIVFDEVLNIEMMENAWNKVIQKHDMLRAIVLMSDIKLFKNQFLMCIYHVLICVTTKNIQKRRKHNCEIIYRISNMNWASGLCVIWQ